MTPTRYTLTTTATLVTLAAMLGCTEPPAQKGGPTSMMKEPPAIAQMTDPSPKTDPGKSFVENNHMDTVFFAQDEWKLNDEAKTIIKKNVDWLNENPAYRLEIDGYADSRGTPDQALAMSQRRAAAVREYYAVLGIPKSRIATVALGQTGPLCLQDSEDCWKQNRRVETLIESKAVALQ